MKTCKNIFEYVCTGIGDIYPDGAIRIVSSRLSAFDLVKKSDLEMVAEEASKQYFGENDGWEANWPQKIAIYTNGIYSGTCLVEREDHPSFYATIIDEPD